MTSVLPPPAAAGPSTPGPSGGPASFAAARATAAAIGTAVGQVVLGKPSALRLCVDALLAGGHVLLEDLPGVGKTVLAKALARSIGGTAGRVQGTADLLPADITGFSVLDQGAGAWQFRPGPVFNNVVLVDEINRATPRAQSALLEAMQERHVTVDGAEHPLPRPFHVIATQNPLGDAGTFPLVAGQRDRFAVAVSLGLPGRDDERDVMLGRGGERALEALAPAVRPDDLLAAIDAADRVTVHRAVADYALDLVDAVRHHAAVGVGPSPRGSKALVAVARAHALVDGRDFVAPDDVKAVAIAVLAHRLVGRSPLELAVARQVVGEALTTVAAPRA